MCIIDFFGFAIRLIIYQKVYRVNKGTVPCTHMIPLNNWIMIRLGLSTIWRKRLICASFNVWNLHIALRGAIDAPEGYRVNLRHDLDGGLRFHSLR